MPGLAYLHPKASHRPQGIAAWTALIQPIHATPRDSLQLGQKPQSWRMRQGYAAKMPAAVQLPRSIHQRPHRAYRRLPAIALIPSGYAPAEPAEIRSPAWSQPTPAPRSMEQPVPELALPPLSSPGKPSVQSAQRLSRWSASNLQLVCANAGTWG